MGIETPNSTACTFQVKDDLIQEMPKVIFNMRKNGCKGFSKTLLLNAGIRHLLKEYEKGGVKRLKKLTEEEYKEMYERRFA